jgi:hypothetical protein
MTTATPIATSAIAEELVAFCRGGRNMDAINTLCDRQVMDEMALYTVNDGKVVREEFFYNPNNT